MVNEKAKYIASLDETVFEHRNKEYGAYNLRISYKRILTRSFFIGTILFCSLASIPFILTQIEKMNAKKQTDVNAKLVDIQELPEEEEILEQPKEDTPPPPPPPKEEAPQVETIQNLVPEPTKEPKVETPPPTITKQKEGLSGTENIEGEKPTGYVEPKPQAPATTGQPGGTGKEERKDYGNTIQHTVDVPADFPGGEKAFRQAISDRFDTEVMSGEAGVYSAEVQFVVEKDGSISQVTAKGANATFNKEAERTVRSIKKKWKPAQKDGQSVRSYFRVPVKMLIEES